MNSTIPADWRAANGMWVIESLTDPALQAMIARDDLVIELFAAGGGMSEGMKAAGLDPMVTLGIEWDSSACMTATEAGHPRFHADIQALDPKVFGTVFGIHGSPSCQGFSPAGKGQSRGDTDLLLAAVKQMGAEPERVDEILAEVRAQAKSDLSSLSLEPLRWIITLRPRWFTLEQVRTVLPLWEAYADVLRPLGYSVWTGLESSEKFGVPQTRVRALAMGSLDRDVSAGPQQTHSRYITHGKRKGQQEPGFLPYVTMAQALERAGEYTVVSNYGTTGNAANRGVRTQDDPAATVTTKTGRNKIVGARVLNSDPCPQERTADAPAFTVTGGGRNAGFEFMGDVRNSHGCVRSVDEPAPTLTSSADNGNFRWVPTAANEGTTEEDMEWAFNRPSATIVGSFHPEVVAKPAWRKPGDGPRQKAKGSISISVREAGILQSFRADYPWTGNQTKQWEQVGNAVPPLLGQALVETVLGIRPTARKAA